MKSKSKTKSARCRCGTCGFWADAGGRSVSRLAECLWRPEGPVPASIAADRDLLSPRALMGRNDGQGCPCWKDRLARAG